MLSINTQRQILLSAHFVEEKTWAQRGNSLWPRPQTQEVTGLRPELRSEGSASEGCATKPSSVHWILSSKRERDLCRSAYRI